MIHDTAAHWPLDRAVRSLERGAQCASLATPWTAGQAHGREGVSGRPECPRTKEDGVQLQTCSVGRARAPAHSGAGLQLEAGRGTLFWRLDFQGAASRPPAIETRAMTSQGYKKTFSFANTSNTGGKVGDRTCNVIAACQRERRGRESGAGEGERESAREGGEIKGFPCSSPPPFALRRARYQSAAPEVRRSGNGGRDGVERPL